MLKRAILYIVIFIIILLLVFLLWPPFSFSLNKDTQNVKLRCFVYDKTTKKPIPQTELFIENWLYEGGDYDGYGKQENRMVLTNNQGYYETRLKKSAYIVVYASKGGYKKDTLEKYANEQVDVVFYLDK